MTEPVAYMIRKVGETLLLEDKPSWASNSQSTPLYTAEQLQSKIQLTNSEYELLAKVCRGIGPFNKIESNIEIVPNMKWFVRSKERDDEGDYAFISGIETPDDWGYSKRHDGVHDSRAMAHAFDTQEEAERWKNPLTEAVQLPVEGE